MSMNCHHPCTGKCWPPMGQEHFVCWPVNHGCTCNEGPNPGIHPREGKTACMGSCGQTCKKCGCNYFCSCGQNNPATLPWPLPGSCGTANPCRCTCGKCGCCRKTQCDCESCMDFDCDDQCPFLSGGKHPMTHDEMCRFMQGICYGRMIVCVDGILVIEPVCCTMRECNEGTIFSLRFRTEKNLVTELHGQHRVTLQFDRWTQDVLCMLQAVGTVEITGTSCCVTVVEVKVESMTGVCYRKGGSHCGNHCGSHCGNNCQNNNSCEDHIGCRPYPDSCC